MTIKRLAAILAIVLTVASTVALGQMRPATPNPNLEANLTGATAYVYKRVAGAELKLWVFWPRALMPSEARPAIVFFGGDGWTTQSPTQFTPQARYLATKGMVTVVAAYRVRNPDNATPFESVADAKSAIRWLREHAKELHIAPKSLAAGGGSAGGHIALTAAVVNELDEPGENLKVSSKPNALVLFNPVPNTVVEAQAALGPEQQGMVALLGPRAREISPIHHLGKKNLPPTIIFHGKADALVPFPEVDAFCKKAVELGNRCELVGFEDATHGFFNPQYSMKWYYETLSGMEQFLRSLRYIR
jgi:acetyl esterase/lipase